MNKNYPISGTFIDEITYDIPSSNWDNEQWAKDLDYMKKVGIDTVITIRAGFNGKMIYPSKVLPHLNEDDPDFADFIFKECEKRNMKVIFGLYISNLTWNEGDADEEIRCNRLLIDEVCERYGHYKSFYGWYIPHEVGSNVLNIAYLQNTLAKMCKDKTPDKKVMFSPFFYCEWADKDHPLSPEETYKEWKEILKDSKGNIDLCAFQDGSAPYEQRSEYFKQAKKAMDEQGIEIWANIEMFDKSPNGLMPVDFNILKSKINVVKPIVSKMITFEFSHFMSPQSIYPSARNLYKRYKDYYGK